MQSPSSSGKIWSLVATPASETVFVRSLAAAVLAGGVTYYVTRKPDKVDGLPKPPPKGKDVVERGSVTASRAEDGDSKSDDEKRVRFDNLDKDRSGKPMPVAVFWDVDNCAPPTGSSGRTIVQAIRKHLSSIETGSGPEREDLGAAGPITSFKAYLELSSSEGVSAAQVLLRSELQGSGVSLIDTPKSGRKDVADKMIIADIMAFALDVPAPARIVLISGDRDFAYPLSLIRGRGYQVVLITPPIGAVPILEASANHVARWRQDVLGLDRNGNGKLYPTTPTKPLPRSSSPGPYGKSTPSKPASTPMQPNPSVSSTPSTTMLSGPGAGPVPRVFAPLVQALEECAREGQVRPLRSRVALRLTAIDKDVYEKAGASSWRDYSEVAVAAGIVVLGGTGVSGHEWIALRTLNPNNFQVQPAVTPSKKQPMPTSDGQQFETPTKKQPPTAPASYLKTPQKTSDGDFEAVSATDSTHGPPEQFEPLFNAFVLAEQACRRSPPIASAVGFQLNAAIDNGLPNPYEAAGVRTWGTYITAAYKARVAKLTPSEREGVAALTINPAYEPYVQKLRSSLPLGPPWLPPQSDPQGTAASLETPTSSPQRSGSPTKKAASILPSIFRKKSKEGTPNSKKTAYDAGPGLKLPHSPSGTIIKVTYFPLANVLLHERRQGQYYCTDTHLHSIVSKHKHMGSQVKNFDVFCQYLEAAESEGVCTIEPGFKPGVRHVRLADMLRDPQENKDVQQNESLPPAGADPTEPMLFPSSDAARKRVVSTASAASAAHTTPTSSSSTESDAVGTAGAAPGSATATEADRRRFKPLMDVMFWFAKQSPAQLSPRRSIVYSMLLDRWAPGGNLQAWLEERGATSIGDYTRQGEKLGFILCERDTKPDGTAGSKLLRLAPKYAALVSQPTESS